MSPSQRLYLYRHTRLNATLRLTALGGDFDTVADAIAVLQASVYLDEDAFARKKFTFTCLNGDGGIIVFGEREWIAVILAETLINTPCKPLYADSEINGSRLQLHMSSGANALFSRNPKLHHYFEEFFELLLCPLPAAALINAIEVQVCNYLDFANGIDVPSQFETGMDYIDSALMPIYGWTSTAVDVFGAKVSQSMAG